MTHRRDLGIFWVVFLAAMFWISVWKHETLVAWIRKVWMN
jgi:hypothetical protein